MLFKNLFRNFSRVSRQRRNGTLSPSVQTLELRALPAGTVTAQLIGTTLLLTGNSQSNSLQITVSEAGIDLEGTGTAIKFNGQTTAAGTPLHLTNAVNLAGSLIANLGSGNDTLTFNINASSTFKGDVIAYMGSGNDQFITNVSDGVMFTVGGSVTTILGSGNDIWALNNSGTSKIKGSLYVDGGTGNNVITMLDEAPTSIEIFGATTLVTAGSYGTNTVTIGGADVTLHGPVTITTGFGQDDVEIFGNVAIDSVLYIDTFAGDDFLELSGLIEISGPTTLIAGEGNDVVGLIGDETAIANAAFGETMVEETQDITLASNLVIYGLGGNDVIGLSGTSIDGGLFVYAGVGNDCLGAINVHVEGVVYVFGEAGNDSIVADVLTIGGFTYIDTGLDNDTVTIDEVTFANVVIVELSVGNDNFIAGTFVNEGPYTLIDGSVGTDKISGTEESLDQVNLVLSFEGTLSEAAVTALIEPVIAKFVQEFVPDDE